MDRKIFIACPITKFFLNGRKLDEDFEFFIKEVRKVCLSRSERVFLALDRELYGEALMDPLECVPLDYQELVEADDIIAFPEDSLGVAVEMGWASAFRKRMLVFTDQRFAYSSLIKAIDSVSPARVVQFFHEGYRESLPRVKSEILDFLGQAGAASGIGVRDAAASGPAEPSKAPRAERISVNG
jgi:hypothetical protein